MNRINTLKSGITILQHSITDDLRFQTPSGELLNLGRTDKDIYIVSGQAWLTVSGKDHILTTGDRIKLVGREDDALISSLGESSVTIEVRAI